MVSVKVPEASLVEVARTLAPITPEVERTRRIIAAKWLSELHSVIKKWNDEFIVLLKRYPGFKDSVDRDEYKRFFSELEKKRGHMLHRSEETKALLCEPIIRLHHQFPTDFVWLEERNPEAYYKIYNLITGAYRSESVVIDMADDFIDSVYGWDIDDISRARRDHMDDQFIDENIRHRKTICQRINEYESQSNKSVSDLRAAAREADLRLVPIEDADISGSRGFTDPRSIAMQLSSAPQKEHRTLYTILAFGFGVAFLVGLLTIAIFIPDPKPFQVRIFTTVLSVAAAGAASVMTGLINTEIKLGTQLVVGATGALAVFVVVYMVNPAVLPS